MLVLVDRGEQGAAASGRKSVVTEFGKGAVPNVAALAMQAYALFLALVGSDCEIVLPFQFCLGLSDRAGLCTTCA